MRYQSECVPKTFCSRAQQARTVYFFICLAGREHSSRKTSVVGDTHRLISCKNDHCFWACLHPAQQTFAMSKADKKKVSRGLLTRDTHTGKKKKKNVTDMLHTQFGSIHSATTISAMLIQSLWWQCCRLVNRQKSARQSALPNSSPHLGSRLYVTSYVQQKGSFLQNYVTRACLNSRMSPKSSDLDTELALSYYLVWPKHAPEIVISWKCSM